MRPLQLFVTSLIFVAYTALYAAVSGAATLGDWLIPAMIGICFAVSLNLVLFQSKKNPRCKDGR